MGHNFNGVGEHRAHGALLCVSANRRQALTALVPRHLACFTLSLRIP